MEESPDAGVFDLFRSPNDGVSWAKLTSIPSYKNMSYYGEHGNSFIMRFADDKDRNTSWDTNCFYYRTSDAGDNWTDISTDFFKSSAMNLAKVYGFIGDGTKLFLLGHNKNYASVIYFSSNNGWNWSKTAQLNQNQQQIKTKDSWSNTARSPIYATDSKGNFIFTVTYYWSDKSWDSLYNLTTSGVSSINTSGLPDGIVITDLNYLDGNWYLSSTIGLFASTNGINWMKANVNNYYLGMNADNMVKIGNQLFIGTFGNGLWEFSNEKLEIGGNISVCDGDSVTLTATGADSSFSWCCGYGSSKTITIKPSTSTDIIATALDKFGLTISDTVHITVRPKPTANFSIVDDKQCFKVNNFNFLNSSIINTGTYNSIWDFGDGSNAYTQDVSHSYTTYDSTYNIKLLVVSAYGCMDSISKPIFFEKEPIASISIAGDNEICDGDSVTMYANSGANFTYQWYKDANTISGATNPYWAAMLSGKYTCEVTDITTTCSTFSSEVEIIIHTTNLNPNFTASPRVPNWNSGAQQFDPVAFTNLTLNPGDFNFSWLYGDGNIGFDSDPFYNYKFNGTYSVSLTAEHKQTGCRDTFSRTDYILCSGGSVNPCPISVEITYSGIPIICKNDSFLIEATTTGNVLSYIWTHEGNVLIGENGTSIYAKDNGNYLVIISDSNCSVASLPFTLNNYPIVEPIIQSEGSIRPCSTDSMRLFNTNYYADYFWSTGQNGTSIYVKKSGEYFLTVTDIYACKTTSLPYSVNASLLQKPEICLVTVDTVSKNNLIAWERPKSDMIQGYKIYKEKDKANVYDLIGYLPYDSVSVFPDTASILQKRSYRYKISLIDTCNIESAPSDHHKTIHLAASPGFNGEANLIWSHYEGFPFSSYKIYRGTTPYNIALLDSIPSNLNSYTDLNPPKKLLFYQVTVVKNDTCYPTILRAQTSKGPFSQSMSNLRDYNADTTSDYLNVSLNTHTFDTTGGSFVFDIFTNLSSWSAVSDQSWLTVDVNIASRKLTVTATKNTETTLRQANITLSGAGVLDVIIVINQDGVVSIYEQEEHQLLVYPNPFDQYFYLYMPETKGERK
ncbi:MAG: BACON domain-containing protein, partial [Bacteroidetes bacterium]|nr:BACON domain-containing protein [Bacteroidota bacterium]